MPHTLCGFTNSGGSFYLVLFETDLRHRQVTRRLRPSAGNRKYKELLRGCDSDHDVSNVFSKISNREVLSAAQGQTTTFLLRYE